MMKCECLGYARMFGEVIGVAFQFDNGIEVIKHLNGDYEGFDYDVGNQFVVTSEYIEAIKKVEEEEVKNNTKIYVFSNGIQTFTAFIYDETCWIVDGKQLKNEIYDFLGKFGDAYYVPKDDYNHHFNLKCADDYLGEESLVVAWTVYDHVNFAFGEDFDDYNLNLFIKECNDKGFKRAR